MAEHLGGKNDIALGLFLELLDFHRRGVGNFLLHAQKKLLANSLGSEKAHVAIGKVVILKDVRLFGKERLKLLFELIDPLPLARRVLAVWLGWKKLERSPWCPKEKKGHTWSEVSPA